MEIIFNVMKKYLFLILFASITSCNAQEKKPNESVNILINLLSDTTLTESKCLAIQKEIDKLYFNIECVFLNPIINNFIIHVYKYNLSNITKLSSHELSYCSGLKSILLSLSLSCKFKYIKSAKNRFLTIVDSCYADDKYLKGAYSVLLMYQSRVLSEKEKIEIIQLYYNDDTRFFAIDAILQSVDVISKMDYYLFILDLISGDSRKDSLYSVRLLNDMKVDINLLNYQERIKYIELLQNRLNDNPKFNANIQLRRQMNELLEKNN